MLIELERYTGLAPIRNCYGPTPRSTELERVIQNIELLTPVQPTRPHFSSLKIFAVDADRIRTLYGTLPSPIRTSMCSSLSIIYVNYSLSTPRLCDSRLWEPNNEKLDWKYVTLRNTLRSLCYVALHVWQLHQNINVIHCLSIAAQYNVFWQLGTGTVLTKEATLPVFHVQIKYLSQINYLNKKKITSIVLFNCEKET
jgi:hypothetical protein